MALTEAMTQPELSKFLDQTEWQDKQELEVQLLVEGKELPIDMVCERWQAQVKRMVAKEADELLTDKLAEKFNKVTDFLYNMEKDMRRKVKDDLGLEPDEYDY